MMRLKIFLFLLLQIAAGFHLFASKQIQWLDKEVDFGVIREEEGVATGIFHLINQGRKAIEIKEVRVACGCTDVEYPHEKIYKGDTATIIVKFDPRERPGKFDKGIYVFFDDNSFPENLRIKGTVIASEETLKLFFPIAVSDLHFDTDSLDFGEMKKGMRRREFIDIYNSGHSVVVPTFSSPSAALSFELSPPEITPGNASTLTVYIDSSKLGFTGRQHLSISGAWDGREKIEIPVQVLLLPGETPDGNQ